MTNSESCAGIFIAIRSCPWREIRTSSRIAAFLTELGYELKVGDEVSLPDKRYGVPDFEETALINSVKTFVLTVMDLLK